jgi:heme exporter protein D
VGTVSELLPTPYGRLVWSAVAVLLAVVLGRLISRYERRVLIRQAA